MLIRMEIVIDESGWCDLLDKRQRGVPLTRAQVDTYNAFVATCTSMQHALAMVQHAYDAAQTERALQKESEGQIH